MDPLSASMMASLILLTIIVLGTYIASHRLSGWQMLVAIAMLALGIALVVFPNAATYVAMHLGVGRGTDLITYLAILGGLFAAANFYFRFKRQEQQMIEIVRELALRSPRKP